MDYYIKRGGKYGSPDDINLRLFIDASSYVNLNNEWGSLKEKTPIDEVYNLADNERTYGTELSYVQACSFVAFLIDNYSFNAFLEYCEPDGTCEDVFGKSYDSLKPDWIDYLSSPS